jgi:hypothetical protein
MWDPDKTGVTRTKPVPGLYNVDLALYQEAADSVRRYLQMICGLTADHAVLDPYLRVWTFYNDDGILVRVEHELMDRIYELVRRHGR